MREHFDSHINDAELENVVGGAGKEVYVAEYKPIESASMAAKEAKTAASAYNCACGWWGTTPESKLVGEGAIALVCPRCKKPI